MDPSANVFDLDLTTCGSIEETLNTFAEYEERINGDLEYLLGRQCQIDSKMKGIGSAICKIKVIDKDAKELNTQIIHTAYLAESVSAKVRRLDLARTRVSDCQQRVHDLIDLQLCSQGVLKAIAQEEYEVGSGHISRFLAMDLQLLRQTADDVQGSENSAIEAIRTLETATSDMRSLIAVRFDEAVKMDDLASVERFFKIFPLLDRHQDGIIKFSEYICTKLRAKNERELRNTIDSSRLAKRLHLAYADAMTSMLENYARVVEVNQPIAESFYGFGYLIEMLQVLQRQCDKDVKNLITSYNISRQIEYKKNKIRDVFQRSTNINSSGTSGSGHYRKLSGSSIDKLNPNEIDSLIVEITVMHSRIELYFRFMRRRITSDIDASSGDEETHKIKLNTLNDILNQSDLSRQMQELLGTYLLFERYD